MSIEEGKTVGTEMKSLARGLKSLQLLADAPTGLAGTELAKMLGVDKSSTSRLMQTLVVYGFVDRDPDTRRYRLGPQVVSLSRSVLRQLSIRDFSRPFLHSLVERTGETAHLAILAQGQALHLELEESPATLRVSCPVGTLVPLHCTSIGKALLAFGELPIPASLPRRTPRTICDPAILKIHLEQTVRQGYAVDDEESEIGVRCIAAPVYGFDNRVLGALGISAPVVRLRLEDTAGIAATVLEVATALSEQLQFKGVLKGNRTSEEED